MNISNEYVSSRNETMLLSTAWENLMPSISGERTGLVITFALLAPGISTS